MFNELDITIIIIIISEKSAWPLVATLQRNAALGMPQDRKHPPSLFVFHFYVGPGPKIG